MTHGTHINMQIDRENTDTQISLMDPRTQEAEWQRRLKNHVAIHFTNQFGIMEVVPPHLFVVWHFIPYKTQLHVALSAHISSFC